MQSLIWVTFLLLIYQPILETMSMRDRLIELLSKEIRETKNLTRAVIKETAEIRRETGEMKKANDVTQRKADATQQKADAAWELGNHHKGGYEEAVGG